MARTTSASSAPPAPGFGPFALAGLASIGAAAVHVAAIGAHAAHPAAAGTFAVVALAQLAWGALALTARRPAVAAVGAGLGAAALLGWYRAKTSGLGSIDGLDRAQGVRWPDLLAAALAACVVLLLARTLLAGDRRRSPRWKTLGTFGLGVVAVAVLGAASAGSYDDGTTTDDAATEGHQHAGPAVAAYDPSAPIDLSGAVGASAAEQARAETLLAATQARLPRFERMADARSAGYRSLGDAASGYEHLVASDYLDDAHVLDADRPESLVYAVAPDGRRTLVAAMYLLAPGTPVDEAPDVGGPLTPWHVHADLCATGARSTSPTVVGLAAADGTCGPPAEPLPASPTLHVWVAANRCGPFATIEGASTSCSHAHGG